ncbi:MAG: TolC family protein, partial [Asticcacaulis sp.]
MKKTFVSLLFLSSALSGCLSTPYETPAVTTPDRFAHATQQGAYAAPDKWWEAFGDARLNRLIETALSKNNDLAAAALRVQKAQLQVRGARLDQWPQASGSVSASKTLNESGTSASSDETSYSASFSVAYELDLWGRLKATTDATRFEATATEADLEAARLSLIGTTAQAYWQIAYTHQQIRDAEQSLDYARRVRDMVRVQHQAGSVSGIEAAEADQTVNAQEASLSALRQQLVENRAALTLLLGGEAWPESDEATQLPTYELPAIAPGLPADLLARRPDLKAAEARLRGTLRSVDATRASMYPALSLTGSAGGSSTELGKVLSDPSSALGVGLSLPFLNFAQ